MKKNSILIIGFIVLIGVGSLLFFKKPDRLKSQKMQVAATIFPIYDIARIIAGDDMEVTLIVPPGTSPHAFDLSAQTVQQLQSAKVLFYLGYGVDDWAASVGESIPDIRPVTMDKDIVLRESHETEHEGESHEDEEEEHKHGPIDPHYWLDPENATIMASTIEAELSALDPEHQAAYGLRRDMLIQDIAKHDEGWQMALAPFTKRDILTFHDAFYYFADHFDLNVVATFEPFVGKEPSPQYLADLHNTVKEQKIRTLFIEPQLSRASLEAFAKDVGAEIGVLDEMGGADGKTSYIALIDANVKEVVRALQVSE